jgi:hypothetical protein
MLPDSDTPLPQEDSAAGERGRDLALLALAIVVVIEGVFAALTVLADVEGRLVLSMGRFALISGLSYMTWQGFALPRWVLTVLAAFAVIGGPVAIHAAVQAGSTALALLAAVAMLGYAAAVALLVLSADVRAFLRQRHGMLGR